MTIGVRTIDELALLDWRRAVSALYAEVRAASEPRAAWELWRETREHLFATHPQSPLPPEARNAFGGLHHWEYDPAYRVTAQAVEAPVEAVEVAASTGAAFRFRRFALARFALAGEDHALPLYWLESYAGGVFLPFADATNGAASYAAGRYLLDTAKGADLGELDGRLVLDFNFAYNPSCSYDPAWSCPLPPPQSRLGVSVQAGERIAA